MLKKICPHCGKIYHAKANAQKYCSSECAEKSKLPKKRPLRKCICKGCGNTFQSVRVKRYCSEDCRMYANGRGRAERKPETAEKPKYTLSQVAAMANNAGMTYGTYVQKYSL